MESKEYDFTRNPVVQNEVFFHRSVPHVVFRFWHVQLTNWSNRKQRTDRSVRGQTLLHNSTRMRTFPPADRLGIPIFHGTDPPC